MRGWLRRNRWGLMLLPVVLIASAGAASSRLEDYWWDKGMRGAQHPDSSGVVHYDDGYDDGFVSYPIKADISLASFEQVDSLPAYTGTERIPATVPTGGVLWAVTLHFAVDPSIVMRGCNVAIMGEDGSRYDADTGDYHSTGEGPIYFCAPNDSPGPQVQVGSTEGPVADTTPGTTARPPTYDTVVYVVTPRTAKPRSVRVWFSNPTYAELPIKQR